MTIKGYITINGTTKHETEMAVLIDVGEDEPVWFPKSQLEDWPDLHENGDVMMTEWIAEEKEVI